MKNTLVIEKPLSRDKARVIEQPKKTKSTDFSQWLIGLKSQDKICEDFMYDE